MKTIQIMVALVISCSAVGCGSSRGPKVSRDAGAASSRSLEERIVEVARKYYCGSKLDPDLRVVIVTRTPCAWKLKVGPESKEGTLQIDPRTLKVIKASDAY